MTQTCRCILQQLLELCWRELCACDGHGHSKLCELDLDVGLLQVAEESGGGDPLGGTIRRTLHHVDDHLCPERSKRTGEDLSVSISIYDTKTPGDCVCGRSTV